MSDILKEIVAKLPERSISHSCFEAANIILYSKDKSIVQGNGSLIKSLVREFKKRIELRPDPELCLNIEETEKIIREIIPEEAVINRILFDEQRSKITIEVEKPGLAIGKNASLLKEIKDKTFWIANITRTPAIPCQIIENIRAVLYENNDERKKFLNRVGHRIYDGWLRGKKQEWIRLSYLGGAREVGRSCIFLQTSESRILIDCGINVANEKEVFPFLEAPEFDINELDAIIISHANLDHACLVPYLFRFGYSGPIYATEPTRDIMALLQFDYIKQIKAEGKEPLYSPDEIKKQIKQCITLSFEEVTDVTPDIRLTFYNSGHVIGSSLVHINIGNGLHNLMFTSNFRMQHTKLLIGAISKFTRLETLMIEATYGGTDCNLPSRVETERQIKTHIKKAIERNGKILMPVSGVGRAQEALLIFEEMFREKTIKEVPVYIDGSVWDITAIHTAYPEYLNNYIKQSIFHKDQNPFLNKNFKNISSRKGRSDLVESEGPAIILATSAMLTTGPSVYYFKELASDQKNMIIFTAFLSNGTLGRRLQAGERTYNFENTAGKNEPIEAKLEIVTIDGFSGNAGRGELMTYLSKLDPKPKRVICSYGETNRVIDLASSIHRKYKIETNTPRNLDTLRLR
ncbi:beta-CASP ribonuclease aCPSF1 [Candidatus Woesearchaeota archaeon]|jgi:uncharacterized protein|nr:beta-CASP ribonuclease aCPSF1 [Candidatus Woesearchaeota archaeon]MBT4595877.1 beta-CASP ribonuclease aCPSF1 [Candidatus Woesearchaeota archaeon]MBT5741274.1 beta-CASP ribonuclease aCPSF1 [Candidatus Woesearchaeota archaeon]MBT6505959.1 beta-CASP ribonuclease aCPSF1 [Candidatus Woesearchaeota archaeon]MBT7296918.1 beta-CASP ribonuclease aCPSF1 [Candidatus Woesearchaeota archaeon]